MQEQQRHVWPVQHPTRAGILGALGYRLGLSLVWLAPSLKRAHPPTGVLPPTEAPGGQVNRRILSSERSEAPRSRQLQGAFRRLWGQLQCLLRLVGDSSLFRSELADPVRDRDSSPLRFLLERSRQRVRQADLDLFARPLPGPARLLVLHETSFYRFLVPVTRRHAAIFGEFWSASQGGRVRCRDRTWLANAANWLIRAPISARQDHAVARCTRWLEGNPGQSA